MEVSRDKRVGFEQYMVIYVNLSNQMDCHSLHQQKGK